jgi:ribonuclease VapC
MVIDTSAVVAIILGEPERDSFLRMIQRAETAYISTANLLEASIVIEYRLGEAAGRELDLLLRDLAIQIVPVDADQGEIARRAWRKYGKGRHNARLNFGDCFAYALATSLGEPLLAKGNDFSRCDVKLIS